MGGAPVEGEDAAGSQDAGDWEPRPAASPAMTTSRPATRTPRSRIRRVVRRAGCPWVKVTPPFQAAWCCQHVCGFRYADDMRLLGASEHARLARRGRAPYGGSHTRWPAPGSDRG